MNAAVHISLEEFIARPDREDGQREELIEGELIVSPSAKVWHAAIVDRIREMLAPLKRQGYVLGNDFACILGKMSMPAPDLAAVTVGRWSQAEDNDGWLDAVYVKHRAEQVWIVYRKTQTVTVVTLDGTTQARMGENLEFHGVQVSVSSIFVRSES